MRVALVSLPWPSTAFPSAPLGALAAFLRRERPAFRVECRLEYITVAALLGEIYEMIAVRLPLTVGEFLYIPELYPGRRASARCHCARVLREYTGQPPRLCRQAADELAEPLGPHLDRLAADLASGFDAVGLSVSFSQIFASLALARRLKARAPGVRVVLGGAQVTGEAGPALLAEYPFLDFVIQGEGERPLVALLDALAGAGGDPDGIRGVLSRANASRHPAGASQWPVERADDLPTPDYDAYFARRAEVRHVVALPLEGARGCWWDRTHRTGDPRDRCYFCTSNLHMPGYRPKSAGKIVAEMDELGARHAMTEFQLLDSALSPASTVPLADAFEARQRDCSFGADARVEMTPYEILRLWEAGCREIQFGIEGLSSSYLRRMGKGTTTIQNLQAMKTCMELGLFHSGNLLIGFPSATAAEVAETRRVIETHAACYQPLNVSTFRLRPGSTVALLPEEFQVRGVRNHEWYRSVLPAGAWRRLRLPLQSWEPAGEAPDWDGVVYALRDWYRLHLALGPPELAAGKAGRASGGRVADPDESLLQCCREIDRMNYVLREGSRRLLPLYYQDGGDFLRVVDNRRWPREGKSRVIMLREDLRELYLFALEIRRLDTIRTRFASGGAGAAGRVRRDLEDLEALGILYREGEQCLSLAVAESPQVAARRIRESMRTSGGVAAVGGD